MTPAVQQVVEFAKRLPGFNTLPQDDQLILIKLGFFEVWLTRVTRLSTSDCIVFDDGTAIAQNQLDIVYDPPFAKSMLAYVRAFLKMQLSEEEMALYTAHLLLCPQRNGLSDQERISGLHHAVQDAFQHAVVNSGSSNVTARLEAFAAATRDVRALGTRHNELLNWCRVHWPRLALPALFSEIFDIPKSEEDSGEADHASATVTQIPAAPK
ncbi:ligand-binding domain of nuclear hormone receptor domain-containing protein [Phthorimaea operculella]|nr:ligand-binding domain of nuclear hormone receptor domain-containing protein [Phthorimaea operculella]